MARSLTAAFWVTCSAATVLVGAPHASACNCIPPGDVAEEARESPAVFLGYAVSRSGPILRGDSPFIVRLKALFRINIRYPTEDYLYGFHVIETFKGAPVKSRGVFSATHSSACGYTFELGKQYLVFTYAHEGRAETSICDATGSVPPYSNDDFARLRKSLQGPSNKSLQRSEIHKVLSRGRVVSAPD